MSSNVVLVHAGEAPPDRYQASVLLSGPIPGATWHRDAIGELTRRWRGDGDLVAFVPEPRTGPNRPEDTVDRTWARYWGDRADIVLLWMPRPDPTGRSADEDFGRWWDSGRVVLGAPAQHGRHQRDHALTQHVPVADTVADTVAHALNHIGAGADRVGGQRHVPLLLWRTPSFRSWLTAQENAGNELRSGRLDWTFRVCPAKDVVLFWAFHAEIWVAAERRVKANEVVISRPSTSTVVAYRRAPDPVDSEIVIVREFRSPATSKDGYVRELPGGSRFVPGAPIERAVAEMAEETGIVVATDRIRVHRARQPAGALSAHQMHVFSVELTEDELRRARADSGVHGVAEDTERTYVEVHRFADLLAGGLVDWATLGAITEVLLGPSAPSGDAPRPHSARAPGHRPNAQRC